MTKEFVENGLKIKQWIIPDGTVWTKDSGSIKKGTRYKEQKPLIPKWITVHNPGNGDAYTFMRATWNQNMNLARVHYYVDDKEAWQLLEDLEQAWHAGDGDGEGNTTSLSIEICMGSQIKDKVKAEANGALLTAILMKRHKLTIDRVVPHKKWKRSNGTYKNCPTSILPHWDAFIAQVKKYYDEITKPVVVVQPKPTVPTPAPVVTKDVIHTVAKGDSLSKIASKYKTTVAKILTLNPTIKNPSVISIGQKILISKGTTTTPAKPTTPVASKPTTPVAPKPVTPTATYVVVKSGDTLIKIANKNKTTLQNVLKLNPNIKNPSMIRVGDKIRVK